MPRPWLLAFVCAPMSCWSAGSHSGSASTDALPCAVRSACGVCISPADCAGNDGGGDLELRGTAASDPTVSFGSRPSLSVALGGTYVLHAATRYGPTSAISAEVVGDALEIVSVGSSTITVRGIEPGVARVRVRQATSSGAAELPLRVAEIDRVEVGLPEFASTEEDFVSRSVVAGGRAVVQVHLFDADGGRVADMGLRSASATTAWVDVGTRWDIVAIDVPADSSDERPVFVETSDGRLWPASVDVVPDVDHIGRIAERFALASDTSGVRIERTECFTSHRRGRLVSGDWSFEVAGELNFRIERRVDYFGYMTCARVSSAQSGVRRLRVGAAGYEQDFDIAF